MGTTLITGCDKGIGRSLALQLHERGEHVIATCKDDSDELRNVGLQVEPGIDVTDMPAIKALADRLKAAGIKIDVLISNAGINYNKPLGEIDYDAMLDHLNVNALGPLRVTEALLECLNEGAKVGIITSRIASLGENESGGVYAYRISKCAANMVAVNLNHDLRKRGMMAIIMHPGMVTTDMAEGFVSPISIGPDEAAEGLIRLLDEAVPGDLPEFRHINGELLPW